MPGNMCLTYLYVFYNTHRSIVMLGHVCSAWLPGPVIGGQLIDGTCLLWNTASTASKYCTFYQRVHQRYHLHAVMIGNHHQTSHTKIKGKVAILSQCRRKFYVLFVVSYLANTHAFSAIHNRYAINNTYMFYKTLIVN